MLVNDQWYLLPDDTPVQARRTLGGRSAEWYLTNEGVPLYVLSPSGDIRRLLADESGLAVYTFAICDLTLDDLRPREAPPSPLWPPIF